jgi:ABC-type lipoprotein release transport system permease subunit
MNQFIIQISASNIPCVVMSPEFGADLHQRFGRRVVGVLNNTVRFHCALQQNQAGLWYVHVSNKWCKQAGVRVGDRVQVTFEQDDSSLQFEVSDVLHTVLESDPEAQAAFEQLTPGNRRGLIALVLQVKSTDKQIERALKIAEQLKRGISAPNKVLKKV